MGGVLLFESNITVRRVWRMGSDKRDDTKKWPERGRAIGPRGHPARQVRGGCQGVGVTMIAVPKWTVGTTPDT